MMEKFRQRQIELANKAAKAVQKKAGPATPPGQPPAPYKPCGEYSWHRIWHRTPRDH